MGGIAEGVEVKKEQLPHDKISLLLLAHDEGGTIQKAILALRAQKHEEWYKRCLRGV